MSVVLHSPGPQANFKKGPHWYHESPFLPFCWEENRKELGSPSLKHAAIQKTFEDQSALKPEMFEDIPWPIALELWVYLGRCKKQTLLMWKIMATTYPEEFCSVSSYYCLWTNRPMEPLKGYLDIMNNANCDWRAVLSLSTGYASVADLVSIGNMKNLVALEIMKTQWHPSKYSDVIPQPTEGLENGIVRTWVELAESTGSLHHLRILRLDQQSAISPQVLRILERLPNLQLIIICQCEMFDNHLGRAKRPELGMFEMEGWNALRFDWALEDVDATNPTMQPLGPLLDVYTDTLNINDPPSSFSKGFKASTLGAKVPIMEFALPTMDHIDPEKVDIRARYSAKKIGVLTRRARPNVKRQLSSQGEAKKSGKRVMKDKGARDMADVLNDFL